jgi:hypothetical protein
MNDEMNRALSPIGAMLLELFARQMAIMSLLRDLPNFDEQKYREELRKAHAQLNGVPGVATLRSQASAQRLEEIERSLRTILLVK